MVTTLRTSAKNSVRKLIDYTTYLFVNIDDPVLTPNHKGVILEGQKIITFAGLFHSTLLYFYI